MRTGIFIWFVLLTATFLWGPGPPEQDFRIRIAVEEVRLDAVVLDKRGNQITNLKSKDFQIFQNGIPQQITSCIYINQTQPRPQKPPGAPKGGTLVPHSTAPILSRENVQRVIVFVLDDIPMSFTDFHWTRMGLNKFIESQMQSGDLVAIVRTSRGMSANQMFSSDKRHLLAMVANFRYGDSTHWDLERLIITGERMTPMSSGQEGPGERIEEFFQADADTRIRNLIEAQLWTIRYCTQALQDMPGRKSLLFLSPKLYLPTKLIKDLRTFEPDYNSLYMGAFTRVADDALRAGVVIHMMDIQGLGASPDPTVQDARAMERSGSRIPLSQKTGGLFLEDSNFFVTGSGIGRVNEELKGYYLLSYVPPPETFRPDIYNRVTIKAEPKGSQVHTREGFFGMPQTMPPSALRKPSLLNVVFSPFGHKELEVNLASGYFDDPKKGYLLRSWINLDAQKLNVTETEDGNHTVTIEALCVTSDINDFIQDVINPRYVFGIKKEDLPWVRAHGIRFSLFLPVKKPGAYYVRAAVQDQGSGAVGSAYQFIEIPDLKKNRLCLSNLFILHRDEDGSWIRSGMTEETGSRFSPVLSRDENKSPALRKYRPGESFEYVTVIYNAKVKEKLPPDLESQVVLYRNGHEVYRTEPEAVNLSKATDFKRIPIRNRMIFGNNMPPGEYILQLRVNDRQAKKKDSGASQSLSFEIVDPDRG
jgi:VWFA-related protein